MAAMKKIVDRLQCTKALLDGLKNNPSLHAKHVASQLHVLTQMLLPQDFGADDIAAIAAAVQNSGLTTDAQAQLLHVAAGTDTASSASSHRCKLQNYVALANYLPKTVWQHLETLGWIPALTMLCEYLCNHLHLRHPSEKTFQKIAAVHSLKQLGRDKVLQLSRRERFNILNEVKTIFRRVSKGQQAPPMSIIDLPAMPATLQQQIGIVFIGDLIVSEFDACALTWISDMFPCRMYKDVAPASEQLVPQAPMNDAAAMMPMMHACFQLMRSGFQTVTLVSLARSRRT